MDRNEEKLAPTVNIKLVRDTQGRAWLCDATVSTGANLGSKDCVLADEVVYDRMFGG